MAIETVSLLTMPVMPASPVAIAAAPTTGFASALGQLISSTETSAVDANKALAGMIEGTGDVHDAMIAMQKAEMTLQLTVQVRNKLVQAYQDIMRMTI